MQETLYFKTQSGLSHEFLLSCPVCIKRTSLCNTTILAPKLSCIRSSLVSSYPTQIQNPIICAKIPKNSKKPFICARKHKRRKGSLRLLRFIFEGISIMASEVNILPPPLNLVVGEIGGGDRNGGAVWFWKIFGGGSFDGWSSKRKRKALLLGFLGICGLGLLFGKELERNVLGGFLGFWLLGGFLIQWWEKRRTKDWLLGFCLGVVFVGLGLKKDQMQNIVERIMVCSPMMDVGRRGRRKGGRGL